MFDNIGSKIKTLASTYAWGGIIVSIIIGVILIAMGAAMRTYYGTSLIWRGIAIIILGSLFSWISSFVLYGFGELIVKTTEIAKNTNKILYGIGVLTENTTEITKNTAKEKNDESLT